MAKGTAILAVKVIGDSKGGRKALNDTAKASDKMSRALSNSAKIAGAALVGVGAAALKAANAAAEDQQAQAKLAKAMENVTGASAKQIKATEAVIDKLARATGVADDQLRPAFQKLVTGSRNVEQAQKDLAVAIDLAVFSGKDVETVSQAIAKAYGGQTGALKKLIPSLDETILKSGDMNAIMAEVAKVTEGSAAAAAETTAGKMDILRLRFDEVQESLGNSLIPALETAADKLEKILNYVEDNQTQVKILAGIFIGLSLAIIAVNTAIKLYQAAAAVATAAQWAWNIALNANPIGLIVLAVALFIGYIYIVIKVLQKLDEKFKILDKAKIGFDLLKDAIKRVVDWIKKIKFPTPPKWFTDSLKKGGKFVSDLFGSTFEPTLRAATGVGAGYALAPSIVTPPGQLKAAQPGIGVYQLGSSSAGMTINISVNGFIGSERALAQEIERSLVKLTTTRGRGVAFR